MNNIAILKWVSYDNLPELEKLCRKHPSWVLKEVSMDYNPSKGLPRDEAITSWPFKAIFEENGELYAVRIFTLTAGYRGAGPSDLMSILDFLGVNYDEDDIMTKRLMDSDGWIHLRYTL